MKKGEKGVEVMKLNLKILIACMGIVCAVSLPCFAVESQSSGSDTTAITQVKPSEPSAVSNSATADAPIAFFPVTYYQFEQVVEGNKATYDFVVQNKGTAELKITKVKTG